MSTREIYFKILFYSDLPTGLVGYVYKDKNGTVQIGKTIPLELNTNETTVEESVRHMKEIESTEGFMFWNNSPQGEKFFDTNSTVIGKALSNMILGQK